MDAVLETEEEAGAVLVEAGGRLIVTMVLLQPGDPVDEEHEEEVEFEVVGGCC